MKKKSIISGLLTSIVAVAGSYYYVSARQIVADTNIGELPTFLSDRFNRVESCAPEWRPTPATVGLKWVSEYNKLSMESHYTVTASDDPRHTQTISVVQLDDPERTALLGSVNVEIDTYWGLSTSLYKTYAETRAYRSRKSRTSIAPELVKNTAFRLKQPTNFEITKERIEASPKTQSDVVRVEPEYEMSIAYLGCGLLKVEEKKYPVAQVRVLDQRYYKGEFEIFQKDYFVSTKLGVALAFNDNGLVEIAKNIVVEDDEKYAKVSD